MQYFVSKSGFAILDACRAYGLAALLQALTRGPSAPEIQNLGHAYAVQVAGRPVPSGLRSSENWYALLALDSWQQVFLTYKGQQWKTQRDRVQAVIEQQTGQLLEKAAQGLEADFGGKMTLPGSLDPAAFKGLKGLTAAKYAEGATQLDDLNWALACLGAAAGQRYRLQRGVGGKWEFYVTLPVPEHVQLDNFWEIRRLVYQAGLSYQGVRNAVAHFSLLLAEAIRRKAAGNPLFPARFSEVLYFSLFQSGQQYKPSKGGVVQLGKLVDMALTASRGTAAAFHTWDYLFRRGSTQGAQDLAEAITEFIIAPSLDSYYRHAQIFLRYIVDPNLRVKPEFLYTEEALLEVMKYAT